MKSAEQFWRGYEPKWENNKNGGYKLQVEAFGKAYASHVLDEAADMVTNVQYGTDNGGNRIETRYVDKKRILKLKEQL